MSNMFKIQKKRQFQLMSDSKEMDFFGVWYLQARKLFLDMLPQQVVDSEG